MVGEQSPMYRGGSDPNRGKAWLKLAAAIRNRDFHTCRRCGIAPCGLKKLELMSVDHVYPWRSFADKKAANDPTNLVTLCRSCHGYKTTVVERALLKGDMVTFRQWVRSLHLKSAVKGITVNQDAKGNWVVTKQYGLDMADV